MRFQNKKISARATAMALVLGVVGVLVSALPAWAAIPGITGLSVATGAPGTPVTITGTGFTLPNVTSVTINGQAATFVLVSATTITTSVPCGATLGAGRVIVTNTDGPSPDVVADNFTVTAATGPTISGFAPTGGPVATIVTITGTNFCGTTQVLFNATPAVAPTIVSATSITAAVPTGATTGFLHVTTGIGTPAVSATQFTVGSPPTITSFTPTSGPVGTTVTITGTNLLGVTSVKFNAVTATTVGTSTATSVTATVPTGATTGKITVTTGVGSVISTGDFTVTTAPVARTVTFGFEPRSRVSGSVTVSGLSACHSFVPVVIQKQKGGSWKWVDTTATTASGTFKTYIPPSNGKFRAKINQLTLVNGVICGGDVSNVVHS